jgi:GntR family transcriptional regulator
VTSEFCDGAETLDRTSPLPLWAQLEAELRRRLGLGQFEHRFPTDRELIEIYEVSRHTARHAVAKLGSDGIVKRERGIGTSIDHQQFEQSLGSLYSLFQLVENSGVEQRSRVLELGPATYAEAAAHLGLSADARLLHLSRLRLADDEPLAIDRLWLPFEIGEPLLDVDFSHTALYDELERSAGRRPSSGWERIRPVVPGEADRILLGLDGLEAVFSLQRLGMLDDRPIEWRITLIRGDRFSFMADWSAGQRSGLRLARAG